MRIALGALLLLVCAASGCSSDGANSTCRTPACAGNDLGERPVFETMDIEVDGNGTPPVLDVTCPGQGASSEYLQARAYCRNVVTGNRREVTTSANLHWTIGKNTTLVVDDTDHKGRVQATCPLPYGGLQYVRAEGECGVGVAPMILRYHGDVLAANTTPDVAGQFNGPLAGGVADNPRIVYPLDGSLHAANLDPLTVQWKAPARDTVFELHFVGEAIDLRAYVGWFGVCTLDPTDPQKKTYNCAYTLPRETYRAVARSGRGGTVSLTLTGTEGAGLPQADSAPLSLLFSPENLRGSVYYFSATEQGIKRRTIGDTFTTPFLRGGDNTDTKCIGCHAVSPDGKKLAGTFYGADGLGAIVDATNPTRYLRAPLNAPVMQWNYATFSPDGRLLLTGWKGVLTLRDGDTGARKFDVDPSITGGRAIMPEWSPDGSRVAFVQVPTEGRLGSDFPVPDPLRAGDWVAANSGNLAVMEFHDGTFERATVVVPSTPGVEYHFYPSWSPDAQFLAFVSATAPGYSPTAWKNIFHVDNPTVPPELRDYVMLYDQQNTRLRMVSVGDPSGPARPFDLPAATHELRRTTSWPRFTPFRQGRLAFLSFSAKLDYGFLVTDGATPQLWMAGVDLSKAAVEQGEVDPSYPPVWMPFQDPREKNHAAVWVAESGCRTDDDCPAWTTCAAGQCR